jgi:hypothetical protein
MRLSQHVCGAALVFVGFVLCAPTFSAHADIRVSQNVKWTSGKSTSAGTRTIEIKGLKMRLQTGQGTQSRVTIYDLESGKRFRLSTSSKEVFELDLSPVSKRWKERIVQNKMQRVIHPSGGKYEVSGLHCDEYTFDFQAPISVDGHAPKQIAHDSGTVCLSQNIAAGAEFANFVHEAQKRGYVLAVAILSPTFSPIGSYFFGEEPNVIVLSAVTKFGYDSYPGAQNPSSTAIEETWTVTEIKSESISDEDFQIPHDWKLKRDSEFDRAALSQPTSRSQTFVRKINSW